MNQRFLTHVSVIAILVFTLGTLSFPVIIKAKVSQHDANEFLIVDCLLPGQIRQLGNRMRYMAARRPIKTSVSDCRIRGGEYVVEDRSSYGAALKMWLPLAKQGDMVAQTNVGEIFEKGLGLTPDYKTAANWYQKAADQGYSPAQINLGQLYEQGKGVPKDPKKAVNLYRSAAGIENIELIDTEVLASKDREIEKLGREVKSSQAESEFLRKQLDDAQFQLNDAQNNLKRKQNEINSERRKLNQVKTQLRIKETAPQNKTNDASTAKLREELSQRTNQLDKKNADLDNLRREIIRVEAEATRHQNQLVDNSREEASLKDEVEHNKETISNLEIQLKSSRNQEDLVIEETQQRNTEILTLKKELDQTRTHLDLQKKTGTVNKQIIIDYEKSIQEKQIILTQQENELGRLDNEVNRLESQSKHYQEELAKILQKNESKRDEPPVISIVTPNISAVRGGLAAAFFSNSVESATIVGKIETSDGLTVATINDKPLTINDNGVFSSIIPLVNERTTIRVVAIDRSGRRALNKFELVTEQPLVKKSLNKKAPLATDSGMKNINFGTFYALIIGNNDYAKFPKLETAINDARKVDSILRSKYGFKTKTLFNADRYQILSALNDFREKLTENDNLLIYYAGHGELDNKNQRGYWLPVDAESGSSANWISNVDVTDILNAMAAKQIIVVADSCYSGSLTRGAIAKLTTSNSREIPLGVLKVLTKKRSRTVLSSGGLSPVLDTIGKKHSVFANAFISVISRNNSVIEGRRLYKRIAERVRATTKNIDFDQIPAYSPIKYAGHEGGDFFLVPSSEMIGKLDQLSSLANL